MQQHMEPDLSALVISATKPGGKVGKGLAKKGIRIVPVTEDEGNVDRYVLSKRLVLERRTGGGFLKGIGARKADQMFQVPNAEYESVDTEKDREDAIEVEPRLPFRNKLDLPARQVYLFDADERRYFIDMVYVDTKQRELILVELKRGPLTRAADEQICRYLDRAEQCPLFGPYLGGGFAVRGVLASLEGSSLKPSRGDVSIRIVNRKRAARALVEMRCKRRSD